MVGSGSSCSRTSWRRACAEPCIEPSWATMPPHSQPRRLASQPKNSSPATVESGRWRAVTALILASSGRHWAGSKVEATRSRQGVERSHARSTMYARAASCLRAPDRGGRIGLVDRVDQHDLGQVQQRVHRLGVAVRRPHQRRQVGDHQRVDDRVEALEVLRADVEHDLLVGHRQLPGLGLLLRRHGGPAVDSLATRLDAAAGSCARRGSGPPGRAGSGSRRATRGRRPPPGSARAPARRPRSRRGAA